MTQATLLGTQHYTLDRFTRLDATYEDGAPVVQYGKLGMRDLTPSHIDALAHSDYTQWPSLVAAVVDNMLVLIDGYHRLEAAKRMPELADKDALEGENNDVRIVESLPVDVYQFTSDVEIVKAALEANLKHGLSANSTSRTRLGVLLLHDMVDNGSQPTFTETALKVGISKVTLWQAWQKEIARASQEESGEASENGEASESQEDTQADDVLKAIGSFAKAMRKFVTSIEEVEDDKVVAMALARALNKVEDKDVVEGTAIILRETFKAMKPSKKAMEKPVSSKKLTQPELPTTEIGPEGDTSEVVSEKKSKKAKKPVEAVEPTA